MTDFLQALTQIEQQISAACVRANRSRASITLTAVSKTQPEERLEAALAAGLRVFGENRVQEAEAHWAHRRSAYPDLELRLIGPLQTNKVPEAVALFDVIETVDREKLAAALAKECARRGVVLRCLVQVNTGEEPQKAGIAPADAAANRSPHTLHSSPNSQLRPGSAFYRWVCPAISPMRSASVRPMSVLVQPCSVRDPLFKLYREPHDSHPFDLR
jgi:pyridoxal phosphate enzyme (YggS family)